MLELAFTILTALTTPCEWEDSRNCYWHAPTMGNGSGTSFFSLAQPDGGDLVIWTNGDWRIYR